MSAASKAGHDDHGHGHAEGGSHGTFKDYMTGFVLSVILPGPQVLVYLVLWVVFPKENR